MIKTLNDRFIAGLHFTGRRENVFDESVRGLVLRIGARRKTWCFTYRSKGGATQWLRLGEYPSLKLAAARDRAEKERGRLADGVDPAAERRKPPPAEPAPAPPAFTFADFVPVYVNFQKGRTKHWEDEHGKIKRYLLPAWGALPLKDIQRSHVVELLDMIEAKGLTAGVNRIQAVVSRMFTVALNRSLVQSHPAARLIKRFKEIPRDKVLTDDELRALSAGLDGQPGTASDVARLRLLLGQRGAETANLAWAEIDFDRALWTLPLARTKTRQRTHVVPLPTTALKLLERRRAEVAEDEPRVFPDYCLTSQEHKAIGTLQGGFKWIDLRRTCRTRLAELGFSEEIADRVLNHGKNSTTSRRHYNQHAYVAEIEQALSAWDAELQRILANKPKPKTNVLPMRSRS